MKKLSALAFSILFAILASNSAIAQQGPPPEPPRGRVIPNIVGDWSLVSSGVEFDDVTGAVNFFQTSSGGEPVLFITDQEGRLFAGIAESDSDDHPNEYDKVTGVVTEDGTVTIHIAALVGETRANRVILWGNVTAQPFPRVITGIGHNFEEFENSPETASFGSLYFILRRVE